MLTSSTIAYWFNGSNTVSLENLAAGQHPVILYADPYEVVFCDDYGHIYIYTLVLINKNSFILIPFEENFEDEWIGIILLIGLLEVSDLKVLIAIQNIINLQCLMMMLAIDMMQANL